MKVLLWAAAIISQRPDIRQRAKIRTDKKRNTKQTVVFRINAIRPANTWLTAIPIREMARAGDSLDTTKEQDQL
jgi:hypothetical protein